MLDEWKGEDGKLLAFAWPGGYPIAYTLPNGDTLCPKCAQEALDNYATHLLDIFCEWVLWGDDDSRGSWLGNGEVYRYARQDMPCAGFVHYEGSPEQCANCNCEIESAYGVPE